MLHHKMQMLSSLLPGIREVVRHAPHATVNAMQLSSAALKKFADVMSNATYLARSFTLRSLAPKNARKLSSTIAIRRIQ